MAHTSEFLDLRRSDSERLRVTVSEYRGRTLINAASNIVVDYLKLKEVPARRGRTHSAKNRRCKKRRPDREIRRHTHQCLR
ncbi:hypothetical protein MJS38_34505 [Burkholderia gladioli]|jgi:hypothetical protein|nr:hypothetical protein BGLA2_1080072 [Burkholderia gladioli]